MSTSLALKPRPLPASDFDLGFSRLKWGVGTERWSDVLVADDGTLFRERHWRDAGEPASQESGHFLPHP